MRAFLFAISAIAVFGATAALAQTEDLINPDRPGIADSSTTLRRGRFQIEAGLERDDSSSGGVFQRSLFTPALLRFGMTDRLELRVEGNGYERDTSAGERSSGWNPVSIGFKAHILDDDAKRHLPSLGIIGRLFVPSGSGEFRSRETTGDVRLAADLNFGEHWSINPNVGVDFDDSGDGRFTAALAALTVQYNFTSRVNAFVDGGLQAPEARGGTSSLLLDAGAAWILGSNTQLDASIGWGAHGETAPRVFWSAGVSRRF